MKHLETVLLLLLVVVPAIVGAQASGAAPVQLPAAAQAAAARRRCPTGYLIGTKVTTEVSCAFFETLKPRRACGLDSMQL
jgi:hypothetical protein